MAIKVTVNSTPKNRISVNAEKREIIRTVGIRAQQTENFLKGLQDVDASSLNNNETLVYDQSSDKFVVKELPVLNGGTF